MIPMIASPSMIGATNVRCSMPRMPASSTSVSATTLKPSASSSNDSDWLSGTAAPISYARVSNSRPMPLASIGLLVAVPGHALDADRGDVAAEAAEALDQGHVDTGTRGGECGRQTGRARTDDQHVGLVDDVDLAGRLGDAAELSPTGIDVMADTSWSVLARHGRDC